jgi:hypothetical protein
MYGLTVLQSHHTQVSSQFGDENPVANVPVGLNLTAYRVT